jgi:hypothetical protein
MTMIVYCGFSRETPVAVEVIDRGCGAGEIACLECGGDGDWTKFHPEPDTLSAPMACVVCKGTGKQLVSV